MELTFSTAARNWAHEDGKGNDRKQHHGADAAHGFSGSLPRRGRSADHHPNHDEGMENDRQPARKGHCRLSSDSGCELPVQLTRSGRILKVHDNERVASADHQVRRDIRLMNSLPPPH